MSDENWVCNSVRVSRKVQVRVLARNVSKKQAEKRKRYFALPIPKMLPSSGPQIIGQAVTSCEMEGQREQRRQ